MTNHEIFMWALTCGMIGSSIIFYNLEMRVMDGIMFGVAWLPLFAPTSETYDGWSALYFYLVYFSIGLIFAVVMMWFDIRDNKNRYNEVKDSEIDLFKVYKRFKSFDSKNYDEYKIYIHDKYFLLNWEEFFIHGIGWPIELYRTLFANSLLSLFEGHGKIKPMEALKRFIYRDQF